MGSVGTTFLTFPKFNNNVVPNLLDYVAIINDIKTNSKLNKNFIIVSISLHTRNCFKTKVSKHKSNSKYLIKFLGY